MINKWHLLLLCKYIYPIRCHLVYAGFRYYARYILKFRIGFINYRIYAMLSIIQSNRPSCLHFCNPATVVWKHHLAICLLSSMPVSIPPTSGCLVSPASLSWLPTPIFPIWVLVKVRFPLTILLSLIRGFLLVTLWGRKHNFLTYSHGLCCLWWLVLRLSHVDIFWDAEIPSKIEILHFLPIVWGIGSMAFRTYG